MVSIDYEGDINRIITIIKSNTTIWNPSSPTGKLRSVQFGEDSYKVHDNAMPYCLVTTPDKPFFTKDSFGIGDGSTDPQHSVQYHDVIPKNDQTHVLKLV